MAAANETPVKYDRRKEDRNIVRFHRRTLLALAVGFLLVMSLVAAWAFVDQVRATKSDRAGCERLNKVRASTGDLEQSLIEAGTQRAKIEPDPQVKTVILMFKARYQDDYQELVESAEHFADKPGSL